MHPADRERVEQMMSELSAGETVNNEYRITREDGSIGWVWAKGEPIRDDEGDVVRVVGLTHE